MHYLPRYAQFQAHARSPLARIAKRYSGVAGPILRSGTEGVCTPPALGIFTSKAWRSRLVRLAKH